MIINLSEIYAELKAWRDERHISVESQKAGYIVNIMEELGELAQALRNYEKLKECLNWAHNEAKCGYQAHKYSIAVADAEHEIIDALCDIAVFTINAGADIYWDKKNILIEIDDIYEMVEYGDLMCDFGAFSLYFSADCFNKILYDCAVLAKNLGFNFKIAMLETIKEISSRTGSYNESAKKWVKDTSDEAKSKWYKANYERARIEK